jgi:hypothetical protein
MEYLNIFIAITLNALVCALIGCVYIKILAYEKVLNWWFKIGLKHSKKWYYEPIWGCEKCVSGQFALWSYLVFAVLHEYRPHNAMYSLFGYNPLFHVFTICIAILFALIISRIFTKHSI